MQLRKKKISLSVILIKLLKSEFVRRLSLSAIQTKNNLKCEDVCFMSQNK